MVPPPSAAVPPVNSTVAVPGFDPSTGWPQGNTGPNGQAWSGGSQPPLAPVPFAPVYPQTYQSPQSSSRTILWLALLAVAVVLGGFTGALALHRLLEDPPRPRPPRTQINTPTDPPDEGPARWMFVAGGQRPLAGQEYAAGARDGHSAEIVENTSLVLTLQEGWQFDADGTAANDIEVFVDDASSGGYFVEVLTADGRFVSAAEHIRGSVGIDLDRVGVRSARMVKVLNRSAAVVHLDAVHVLHAVQR